MASKTFLFLTFFASTMTVILSLPQIHLAVEPQEDPAPEVPQPGQNVPNPNVFDADHIPPYRPNPRIFNTLFNLSAYLAGAPTNSAALNFIPLITILSGALGG